ncbi:MAG: site-specific integrase, partial [Veillonella sp.]|nr:site-specific integrase [Veillonella sp.]
MYSWEQRKADYIFKSVTEKGYPELPVLSASQELGMVYRNQNGIDIQHDKKNESSYKRVSPGQFVIHLRSFQGGFAYSEVEGITSPAYTVMSFKNSSEQYGLFWKYVFKSETFIKRLETITYGIRDGRNISFSDFKSLMLQYPSFLYYPSSARAISMWEQRKWWGRIMLTIEEKSELFYIYYEKWIRIYKEGAIRNVTMRKYEITLLWLKKLVPELRLSQLNRISYQQLLNDYAEFHERQTTMDFHHQIKAAILDAVDEGFINRDPTRKAIIKGRSPRIKKIKYLNQFELHTLLVNLKLTSEINWDWLILIIAKTGMRFSEALALTPKDFDFSHQSLIVDKTWDYKGNGGFLPTKNRSSVRKIQLDWQTIIKFSELIKGLPEDKPIFVKGRVFNS